MATHIIAEKELESKIKDISDGLYPKNAEVEDPSRQKPVKEGSY